MALTVAPSTRRSLTSLALALCAGAAAIAAVANAQPAPTCGAYLWPIPTTVSDATCGTTTIDATFNIAANVNNAALQDAMSRYTVIVRTAVGSGSSGDLVTLKLDVTGSDTTLGPDTDYSYSLSVSAGAAMVTASTIYGAMYGMETFSQLVSTGGLVVQEITINDSPLYSFRGLLADSGRRFLPVSLLESIMDGMSYTKQNVLHLHLSDYAAFRLQLTDFPELTQDLNGQYYSTEDATNLVQYGAQRGIRVMAEVDLPGHSHGLAPLADRGAVFCDDTLTQLAYDQTTMSLLQQIIDATMAVFPEAMFHIGGDETVATGNCTYDSIHQMEQDLQAYVASQGRTPVVWNDVFSTPSTSTPNGLSTGTIVADWHPNVATQTTADGFTSLVAQYNEFYLDQQCCAAGNFGMLSADKVKQCYWFDISTGVSDTGLIMGGEAAMWGDMYCPTPNCPSNGTYSWMFPPSQDSAFSASFSGQIWPRAAAAGAAMWNFVADMTADMTVYNDFLEAHNSRLISRGVDSCPNGCLCDWGTRCGKPYGPVPPPNMQVTLINKCSFNVKVKQANPCSSTYGDILATLTPGQSFVATTDFIVEAQHADGDPYDIWFGGPGWMFLVQTLWITYDASVPTYLAYGPPSA